MTDVELSLSFDSRISYNWNYKLNNKIINWFGIIIKYI